MHDFQSKRQTPTESRQSQNAGPIRKSHRRAGLLCFVHVVPVVVSFSILQLSFRNVYWEDIGAPNQNAKLGGFQVAAKVHEILITVSMSYLMLHHVRKALISSDGLPLGLFEAAFRVTLGGQPFSYGLWTTVREATRPSNLFVRFRPSNLLARLGATKLLLLIMVVTFLGFAVGPASAITVIPKLGWWNMHDIFSLFQNPVWPNGDWESEDVQTPDFSMYIPKLLFPGNVTASSLPGRFCYDASQDINSTCPYAGFSDIPTTLDPADVNGNKSLYNWYQNVTFGTDPSRHMAHSASSMLIARDNGSTVDTQVSLTSISSLVIADYMSLVSTLR